MSLPVILTSISPPTDVVGQVFFGRKWCYRVRARRNPTENLRIILREGRIVGQRRVSVLFASKSLSIVRTDPVPALLVNDPRVQLRIPAETNFNTGHAGTGECRDWEEDKTHCLAACLKFWSLMTMTLSEALWQ
jgi:hypothetical protein